MNFYVLRPELKPYEGVKVDKNTKLKFENQFVKQELKNLVLTTFSKYEEEKFISETKVTVKLTEGEILLFEGENRGYFLPAQAIGTIETAINDLKALADVLDGDKDESKGNEN